MSDINTLMQFQHPVFTGLPDKAMLAFYTLGNVEALKPGEFLFECEQKVTDSFLILSGEGVLLTGGEHSAPIQSLREGNQLPVRLYSREGISIYEFKASRAINVFRYSDQKLAALDPEIQLLITRNLNNLATANNRTLLQQQATQSSSKMILARQLMEDINDQYKYYNGSRAILELLRKIPRLPSYATRLTQMLADEEISAKEAFESAKLDPSLTASVLKQVNSASYGLKHKVMDFQHAFMLLGFNQINQIVMNQGISSTMPKSPEFQQLQLHCVMVSALCQEISQTVKQGSPPACGTIGLLHDIGKSVILLLKREHAKLGFLINLLNADLIGSLLLREWEIPDDICVCMQYQSLPYKAPPYVIPEIHRVNMAVLYVSHLCFDFLMGKEIESKSLRFFPDYMKVLDCEFETIDEFIRDLLLPSAEPRMNSMPKVISNFLKKGYGLTMKEGDVPKIAIEDESEEKVVA